MPISAFQFEVKQLDEQGTFEGIASTYGGPPDLGGDIVMPGAFDTTLAGSRQRPLLRDHKDAIGVVDLADSPQGLIAKGRLTMGVQAARETFALMKDGAIRGLSIGFQSVKEDYKDGVRQLISCKLFEISLCATPMNQLAMVTSMKSAQEHQAVLTALHDFKSDILRAIRERKN